MKGIRDRHKKCGSSIFRRSLADAMPSQFKAAVAGSFRRLPLARQTLRLSNLAGGHF
jgi:hypothetical protein